VDARTGESLGASETAAAPLSTETEAGPKGQTEPKLSVLHALWRICDRQTLVAAWNQVRANGGAPGVDGISIEGVVKSEGGPERFSMRIERNCARRPIAPSRSEGVYPQGQRETETAGHSDDSATGSSRRAALLILEPIFEADFQDVLRISAGALGAFGVEGIQEHLKAGYCAVYDADLKGYFDSIPHDKLLACVRMRVVDRSVLRLIRMWLRAPVVERKDGGKPTVKRNDRGTPQGGVISPLLANIYLHWFDKAYSTARPTGRPNGPMPSWCGMRTTLWCWRGIKASDCGGFMRTSWKGGWD